MQKRAQIFVYLGIIGVLLLVGTIVELLWRRVRFMKQQKEERAFVMQNLTHELRTPVAGLGLSVEQIRADFDTLPENLQSSFLRICDDVQRLKRVIEGSTQYLRSSTTPQDLFLKKKNIASVNDFVESVIARFDEPIEFAPLAQDCSVNEDPYWFAICLQNIIQNALKHGKPPVRVELSPNLKISVIDSGNLHDVSLAELTPAFSKGAHSEGLGLGLSIVNRVIKEMGAKLTVHGAPTTFTIDLKV
jgi:signal transduction histidine kinase